MKLFALQSLFFVPNKDGKTMKIHQVSIEIKEVVKSVSVQTTRVEFITLFGEPDDCGGFSRLKPRGTILKYGTTEFHFSGDRDQDTLELIYRERKVGEEYYPEISIMLNNR